MTGRIWAVADFALSLLALACAVGWSPWVAVALIVAVFALELARRRRA